MAKVGTKAYEMALEEGDTPLSTKTALRCLAAALRTASQAQPSGLQFAACDVEWRKSQWANLPILDLVRSAEVAEHKDEKTSAAVADAGSAPAADASVVEEFLVKHTKGASWKRIHGKSLHQLGLDSLEIVQIRNAFNKTFEVNVPLAVIADASKKVSEIATILGELVNVGGAKGKTETGGAIKGGTASSGAQDGKVEKVQAFMVKHTKGNSWKRIQNKSLHQLALDSLEIVQLRNSFNKEFTVNAPLKLIADAGKDVSAIVSALVELIK
jgi:acyl carrier protein